MSRVCRRKMYEGSIRFSYNMDVSRGWGVVEEVEYSEHEESSDGGV